MGRKVKEFVNLLIVFSAVAAVFAGCERMSMLSGTPVKFNAGVSVYRAASTKVTYGPADSPASSQPIEWEEDDLITIYCDECEDTKVAGYVVTEVQPEGSESNSYASIDNANGNGLVWDEGEHMFYALYPGVNTTGVSATINKNDITGSIPATQTFGSVTGPDDKFVTPNMNYMFMTAKNSIEADESGTPVFLDFKPLSTALEFTITNGFEESEKAMKINSISLISAGHALSGGFAVDMDETGRYGRPKTTLSAAVADADKKVTISFGDSPVEIAYGKTLNFTFFLNPGNATEVNDLTFEIKGINTNDDEPFTRRAKLEDKTGTGVTFHTHQKTRISGIMVPEAIAWEIEGEITVTNWINETEQDKVLQ